METVSSPGSGWLSEYRREGFTIRRGFLSPREVNILRDAAGRMVKTAPGAPGAGRDPRGGEVDHPGDFDFTRLAGGGHVLSRIRAPLARSPALRHAYADPRLLSLVQALYGDDFLPFDESIVIKLPENGAGFAWHQDGGFKTGPAPERGVNFGLYLNDSTPGNGCLHVVPGSHTRGRIDLSDETDGPPSAVPVVAAAGDLVLHSRNLVHGSHANESSDLRVTVYFGFHARQTVAGVYSTEQITQRMRCIPLCIQERVASGLFPGEEPFIYHPLATVELSPRKREQALRSPSLSI